MYTGIHIYKFKILHYSGKMDNWNHVIGFSNDKNAWEKRETYCKQNHPANIASDYVLK